MPNARIMVMEDDEYIIEYLKGLLLDKGYEIVGLATSGEAAIEIAKDCRPDLLLADIQLEGKIDGIEASSVIRKMLHIPVLFLTGHSSQGLFERAKITNPFAYLLKPVQPRELEMAIEMALYRHELETQLRVREQHLNEAQEIGNIGSWDWNIVKGDLAWTDQIYRVFGQSPQSFEATYEAFIETVHPDDRELVQGAVNEALETGNRYEIEHRIVHPSGEEKIVRERGAAEFDGTNTPIRMQGTVQDVTALRVAERQIEHMAFYDNLTGIPNRNLFFDRLKQTLSYGQRNKQIFAVLFLDLDGFKQVNDDLGHEAGDDLLKGVAERLQECVRAEDTVARLGGDEFTFILSDIVSKEAAGSVSKKIIDALSEPFFLNGQSVTIGCSIGISLFPDSSENMDGLVKAADQAMYVAKSEGKNTYRYADA